MQHRLVGDCDEWRTGNGAAQERTFDGREKKRKTRKERNINSKSYIGFTPHVHRGHQKLKVDQLLTLL